VSAATPYTVEPTPSFVTNEEAGKAAYDNGFRVPLGTRGGWVGHSSTTARGDVWIARDPHTSFWLLAITHPGVAAEMTAGRAEVSGSPGYASYAFARLGELYIAVDRAYKLGASLPDAPLTDFRRKTAGLPRSTEAECLVVVRVGQDIFRAALLDYWNGRCPLTGITDTALLRASHIVPWAECESDELRLDVHNGLLLSALWDCAFDAGLISFADDGAVLRSPALSKAAAQTLQLDTTARLAGLTGGHRLNLAQHRRKHGFSNN